MKNLSSIVTSFIISLNTSSALAQSSEIIKIFNNKECIQTDSCDLKKLYLKITRSLDSKNQNGRTYMEGYYETQKIDQVEKYAIVQFIKGGVYNEYKLGNEPIEMIQNTDRDFFGKRHVKFIHPELVIDSVDTDPVYASLVEENSRHGGYKIKDNENLSVIFDNSSNYSYYLYEPVLKLPRMHFSDMPTGGDFSEIRISAGPNAGKVTRSSASSSMEFKTCVFKTEDIPINAGPSEMNPDDAVGCVEWSNHFIFDWEKKKFMNSDKVHENALNII